MTTLGLDLFSGNGTVDLAKAHTEDNIQFVFRKATEGGTYADPGFATDFDRCATLGIQPGAYCFARPLTSTAQAEAAFFCQQLAGRRGLLALDLEDQAAANRLGLAAMATFAATWLAQVHAATGIRPFLYTYHSWAFSSQFATLRAQWPLWIPLDPATPGEIVQAVHVIGTLGTLDVDTFAGSLAEMQQLGALTSAPAPIPAPAPAPAPIPTSDDGDTMPYLIRTPDGEIDLVIGRAIIHLDGPGAQYYTTMGLKQYNLRQQDGAAARAAA